MPLGYKIKVQILVSVTVDVTKNQGLTGTMDLETPPLVDQLEQSCIVTVIM